MTQTCLYLLAIPIENNKQPFTRLNQFHCPSTGIQGDHGPSGEDGVPGFDGEGGVDGARGIKGSRGEAGRGVLMGEWGEQGTRY